jgi:hypothetical protein
MDLQEAVEFFDHWIPEDPISNRWQAWQTLKSAVLAQQTHNKQSAPCSHEQRRSAIVCPICNEIDYFTD